MKPGVAKEMVRVDKHVSSQNEEPSVNILAHSDLQKKILLLSGLHQHPPAERQSSSPLSLKKKIQKEETSGLLGRAQEPLGHSLCCDQGLGVEDDRKTPPASLWALIPPWL